VAAQGVPRQLRWEDFHRIDGELTMIHVRRGGSRGITKDKDDRFVPVHPKVAEQLSSLRQTGPVFRTISERRLLRRLKELCADCKFGDPKKYKLHSFRHHFASLCANHRVAYRKALAWLGHSSSEMLDLYYHLHDDDSHQAMQPLAESTQIHVANGASDAAVEDHLRTTGQSTIEKLSQVPEFQELAECLAEGSERAGD
jgi:integrase